MPRRRRCWERQACYHITHRCHNREFRFRFENANGCIVSISSKQRSGSTCVFFRGWSLRTIRTCSSRAETVEPRRSPRHCSSFTGRLPSTTIWRADAMARVLPLRFAPLPTTSGRPVSAAPRLWSNRFHSTRIQSGSHLGRCLFYIDLNMVRAGVVEHPAQWPYVTWPELFGERQRYRIVNCATLLNRLQMGNWESFARWYRDTLDDMLSRKDDLRRQPFWGSAIAVGDADWLSSTVRRLALKRFEIREAHDTVEDTSLSVRPLFLGSVNQCKLP